MSEEYWELLDVQPGASKEELEQAFLDQLRVWDPERFRHDEKLRRRAEEKRREIQHAYQTLLTFSGSSPVVRRTGPPPRVEEFFRPHFFDEKKQAAEEEESENGSQLAQCIGRGIQMILLLAVFASFLTIFYAFIEKTRQAVAPTGAQDATSERQANDSPRTQTKAAEAVKKQAPRPTAVPTATPLQLRDPIGDRVQARPPLVVAAISCNLDHAKRLASTSNNLELTDSRGDTAVIWAARQNCLPVLSMLLERGARPNRVGSDGFSPLYWAKKHRNTQMQARLELYLGGKTR